MVRDMWDLQEENVENEEELVEYVEEIKVSTRGVDYSVRELKFLMEDKDLIVPKFQRELVWDSKRKSRFIESILLGYPIPGMFFTELEDGKMLIIDGQQRINTLVEFLSNDIKISPRNDINPKWRGKHFNELEMEHQRKLKNTNIRASVFQILSEETDKDIALYSLFERINTGSIQLNSQEIRKAIYYSAFTDELDAFVQLPLWITAYRNISISETGDFKKDLRLGDQEIIARYFTMKNLKETGELKSNISYKKEINKFMFKASKYNEIQTTKWFDDLHRNLEWIDKNINLPIGMLFRRPSPIEIKEPKEIIEAFKGKKFNISLFESILISLEEKTLEGLKFNEDGFLELFSNSTFVDAISAQTNKIEKINYRLEAVGELFYYEN